MNLAGIKHARYLREEGVRDDRQADNETKRDREMMAGGLRDLMQGVCKEPRIRSLMWVNCRGIQTPELTTRTFTKDVVDELSALMSKAGNVLETALLGDNGPWDEAMSESMLRAVTSQNCRLTALDVSGSQLSWTHFGPLLSNLCTRLAVRDNGLCALRLGGNGEWPEPNVQSLMRAVCSRDEDGHTNCCLSELDISGSELSADATRALVHAIKDNTAARRESQPPWKLLAVGRWVPPASLLADGELGGAPEFRVTAPAPRLEGFGGGGSRCACGEPRGGESCGGEG